MRKISDGPSMELILQAKVVDELRVLQWMLAGAKKHDRPESLAAKIFAAYDTRNQDEKKGYDSGADFDKAWKELTGNV